MPDVPYTLPCPVCGAQTLQQTTADLDIPYFGSVVTLVFICSACHFRHTDTLITDLNEPVRFTFHIRSSADLSVRVVRSSSGTIRMPALGIMVEPGVNAQAFVTNIEGVLERFRDAVGQAIRFNDDPAAKAAGAELLVRLDRVAAGDEAADLIIEDPLGNSAILSERASREQLSAAEADQLQTGMVIIDTNSEADAGATTKTGTGTDAGVGPE